MSDSMMSTTFVYCLHSQHPRVCAGHYFLSFTFLKLKDVTEAQHHVDECLRLRNIIFPVGHENITAGRQLDWLAETVFVIVCLQ